MVAMTLAACTGDNPDYLLSPDNDMDHAADMVNTPRKDTDGEMPHPDGGIEDDMAELAADARPLEDASGERDAGADGMYVDAGTDGAVADGKTADGDTADKGAGDAASDLARPADASPDATDAAPKTADLAVADLVMPGQDMAKVDLAPAGPDLAVAPLLAADFSQNAPLDPNAWDCVGSGGCSVSGGFLVLKDARIVSKMEFNPGTLLEIAVSFSGQVAGNYDGFVGFYGPQGSLNYAIHSYDGAPMATGRRFVEYERNRVDTATPLEPYDGQLHTFGIRWERNGAITCLLDGKPVASPPPGTEPFGPLLVRLQSNDPAVTLSVRSIRVTALP